MDLEKTYEHCRACNDRVCMNECSRHLCIPEEIERVIGLFEAYGDR